MTSPSRVNGDSLDLQITASTITGDLTIDGQFSPPPATALFLIRAGSSDRMLVFDDGRACQLAQSWRTKVANLQADGTEPSTTASPSKSVARRRLLATISSLRRNETTLYILWDSRLRGHDQGMCDEHQSAAWTRHTCGQCRRDPPGRDIRSASVPVRSAASDQLASGDTLTIEGGQFDSVLRRSGVRHACSTALKTLNSLRLVTSSRRRTFSAHPD